MTGVVLLDEEITVVEPSGAATTTVHRVLRPVTAQGAMRVAKVVSAFRSWTETMHVVSAHRTTSDGRTVPLSDHATFVETPQPLADEHCYTDLAQLVLLFPGVRPGDTVEYTLEKTAVPVIPEHFSAFLPVGDLWPARRARRELRLPAGWGDRLRWRALGLTGLETAITEGPDGSVVLRWEVPNARALALERARQPIRQGGPGIWVSTLASWSEVARWYHEMVSGCEELGPDLATLVQETTADISAPSEILRVLERLVAENVTFLGLELGMSSFCPRPPVEVWGSGFGDCKETANLLRGMLSEAGITSNLVLVNTQHTGRIETSVPSHLQFNHVILAVPRDEGSFCFCDPGVRGLQPGELPPGVAGRSGLLVEASGGRFVELPRAAAGDLHLDLDVKMLPDGHLLGWLSLAASAYQARLAVARLLGSSLGDEAAGTRQLLAQIFPEPDVLDVRVDANGTGELPHRAAAYFRARAPVSARGLTVHIPTTPTLLPELGRDEHRETPYFQHIGATTVTVAYDLPPTVRVPEELPPPLDLDTGCVRINARWNTSGTTLSARMRYETTRRLVEPAAWVGCVRAMRSLRAWLDTPILLETARDADRPDLATAVSIPRLPNGRAQLQLVDSIFPRGHEAGRRRAALHLVQEWFADDPATTLEAGLELAVLDQDEGRPERTVSGIRSLLDRYGTAVDTELYGWAEYLLASGLRECGQIAAARDVYDRLSRQPDLSAARRGWAYARAADLRLESEPLVAVAHLVEALELESPALEQQVALLARLEVAGVPGADLNTRLDWVCARFPSRALDVHARLVHEVRRQLDAGRFAAADALLEILERRVAPGSTVHALEPQVRRTREMILQGMRCREVAEAIGQYLESTPPTWWDDVPSPPGKRDQLIASLQRLDQEQGSLLFVRGSLELVTQASVAPDFFTFLLRRSAVHLRLRDPDAELLRKVEQWRVRLEERTLETRR